MTTTKKPLTFFASFPNPNLPESPRGGYRRNIEMLRLLANNYHTTLVIGSPYDFQLETNLSVKPIVVAHPRMPFRWIKIFKYLRKHCSPQTPLICYNPTLHTLPALWLRWLGWMVIVDYVDIQGTTVESTNSLLRLLGVLVEKSFIRCCRYFITSSTSIQKQIRTLNSTANIHLYRGTFQPEDWGKTMLKIDLPPETVKILYLGMMQDFSGVRELLKAFIDLNPSRAHLYIAGHGPEKQFCVDLANKFTSGTVSFPELDDTLLHPFMQQMDILTVPYLEAPRNQANFPSKIIEYLWAGKAILGTQVGEIQRTLEDGRTALLVPPNEIGLRAGLWQLIEDQELRKRLGHNASAEFYKHYAPDIASEALYAFISAAKGG
ncbi:MAG: glycosyltransferase [Anaerolineae bacterium]|nr:glycosyltransferase [Anaerolineae bacterium]